MPSGLLTPAYYPGVTYEFWGLAFDIISTLLTVFAILIGLKISQLVLAQTDETYSRDRFDAFLALTDKIADNATVVGEFTDHRWREWMPDVMKDADVRSGALRAATELEPAVEKLILTHNLLPTYGAAISKSARSKLDASVKELQDEAAWLQSAAYLALIKHSSADISVAVLGDDHPGERPYVQAVNEELVAKLIQNVTHLFSPWAEIAVLEKSGPVPDKIRYWLADTPDDAPWPRYARPRASQFMAAHPEKNGLTNATLAELAILHLYWSRARFRDARFAVINMYDEVRPKTSHGNLRWARLLVRSKPD